MILKLIDNLLSYKILKHLRNQIKFLYKTAGSFKIVLIHIFRINISIAFFDFKNKLKFLIARNKIFQSVFKRLYIESGKIYF